MEAAATARGLGLDVTVIDVEMPLPLLRRHAVADRGSSRTPATFRAKLRDTGR